MYAIQVIIFFILREILNVPRHWVRLMFGVLCEQALQEPFGGAEAREFWSQASKRTPYMVRSGKMVQCWDSDGQQHIGIWRTLTFWPRSALIAGLAHPLPLGIRVTVQGLASIYFVWLISKDCTFLDLPALFVEPVQFPTWVTLLSAGALAFQPESFVLSTRLEFLAQPWTGVIPTAPDFVLCLGIYCFLTEYDVIYRKLLMFLEWPENLWFCFPLLIFPVWVWVGKGGSQFCVKPKMAQTEVKWRNLCSVTHISAREGSSASRHLKMSVFFFWI